MPDCAAILSLTLLTAFERDLNHAILPSSALYEERFGLNSVSVLYEASLCGNYACSWIAVDMPSSYKREGYYPLTIAGNPSGIGFMEGLYGLLIVNIHFEGIREAYEAWTLFCSTKVEDLRWNA